MLKKSQKPEEPIEEDDRQNFQKMMDYYNKMPEQDIFEPPPVGVEWVVGDQVTQLNVRQREIMSILLSGTQTNTNLFIRNLAPEVTSPIIQAAFSVFGPIQNAHVVFDAQQKSRGFGFVHFVERRSAEKSMMVMHDFEILGKGLKLGWGQDTSRLSNSVVADALVKIQKFKAKNNESIDISKKQKVLVPSSETTMQFITERENQSLMKVVIQNLRNMGVVGQLGISSDPENDKGRLYVVCAKHATQ